MLLQVVVMVLLLQSQLILLVLLVLLLHELLMLTKVKVERAVHAELVFDDFVDVTIFEAALQRIAANDLSGPPGKAIYTQLCNVRGGIEADVTLIHAGPDHFFLVTGSGFGVRDSGWVARHLPPPRRGRPDPVQ